jgi:hypothetical protein
MPPLADCAIVCVDPALVHRVWPLVCDLIHAAMKRGNLSSYQALSQSVHSGHALLWIATGGGGIQAAAVTSLAQTEWRKVCEIVACGGRNRARWLHLIERIEDFARAEGCSATRIIGRKGWARVLSGYRAKRVVLEKELC